MMVSTEETQLRSKSPTVEGYQKRSSGLLIELLLIDFDWNLSDREDRANSVDDL